TNVRGALAAPAAWSCGPTGGVSWARSSRRLMDSSRLQLLQRLENAVGTGIHPRIGDVAPADITVAIQHEQRALGRSRAGIVHAVGPRHRSLGLEVREERKPQLAGIGIGRVTPRTVDRNADELRPVLREFGQDLIVERELIAAHGAPVRRIEHENHGPTTQLLERQILAGGTGQTEIGSAFHY